VADQLAAAARGTAEIGAQIADRYSVREALGRGAMAAVFRVHDERTGQDVALKRLRAADREHAQVALALFEREYHTLCQLAHPRIVQVFDYGVDHDGAFYTMELLDGEDLQSKRGRLPWRTVCAVLRDVASSLAILHSRRLLHRDPSPRNVRCTSDGRAKLIDFGAMTPMGTPKHVAGTAPLVPPEALSQQALDARADLFALGALAYWMLTGRYAYPARLLEELRDLWRTTPPAPRTLVPDVPEALDDLVMALLHLDRASRPATAAEVIERLCSIAGLPMEEHVAVTEAYLATPNLVGRDDLLRDFRGRMLGSLRGSSVLAVIEGEPGSGRSRMLDACVLEAKLLGATVARANADEGGGHDYGVLQALAEQLMEALPDVCEQAASAHRPLLAQVLPEVAPRASRPAPRALPVQQDAPPERRHLQIALRDWLLAVARGRRLVLAVDDFDRVDEPSAAVLAALADASRNRNLSLLVTSLRRSEASAALELLREIGTRSLLEPLSAEHTEALLRSVFGDVDDLVPVAARVHELASGNPRATMELARHLVERGLARYEAGRWTLPAALGAGELPPTLAAAQRVRIEALQGDARSLLEALSLCTLAMVPVADYALLTEHGDRGRTYRALDAALSVGILAPAGERFRFSNHEWVRQLRAGLMPDQRCALHARIATLVERWGDAKSLPRHLIEAGQAESAIALILSRIGKPYDPQSGVPLWLLERACLEAERLGLTKPIQHRLRVWTVAVAAIRGDLGLFQRYASAMVPLLRSESGLDDWHALTDVPESERTAAALRRAHLRYQQLPIEQRGFAPGEAITQLARLVMAFVGMVSVAQDVTLTEEIPSLLPLCSLSPAIEVMHIMTEMAEALRAGRTEEGRRIGLRALERLEQPDNARMDSDPHRVLRFGLRYVLGAVEASCGLPAAADRVAPLEQAPGYRVNAWRTRMIEHVMQGDVAAARASRRRAELLQLEDGQELPYPGTNAHYEALAHWYTQDLIAIKGITERLTAIAQDFPGWIPIMHTSRSHYLRLRGDANAALATLEPALRGAQPGRHRHWAWVAGAHVQALDALGRHDEAVSRGLEYLAICERERLAPNHRSVALPLIDALLAAGRVDDAEQLADRCIEEIETAGVTGLPRGASYEARARVAIARRDAVAFERWAECCAQVYQRGHNPALRTKYEHLRRDAEAEGISDPEDLKATADWTDQVARQEQTRSAKQLSEPIPEGERGERALRVLLQTAGADRGVLFGLREGRLELIAADPEPEPGDQLRRQLWEYLEAELEAGRASDPAHDGPTAISPVAACADGAGRRFEPVLLWSKRGGQTELAAVAALHCEGGRNGRLLPDAEVLEALACALLERRGGGRSEPPAS
jgi:hypothetical protein